MESNNIFRIGVLSDTHIRKLPAILPEELQACFRQVDMIIHAGDILHEEVLYQLAEFGPVYAVAGNCDGWGLAHELGRKRIIDIRGLRIGVTHGTARGEEAWHRAYGEFYNGEADQYERLDCLIYGHTHVPYLKRHGDLLVMNPGSPTEKRGAEKYSIGILEIREGEINGSIFYF